jgi:hypothetical protein
VLVSITYVLVSIASVGEIPYVLVSITCVGEHNMC